MYSAATYYATRASIAADRSDLSGETSSHGDLGDRSSSANGTRTLY